MLGIDTRAVRATWSVVLVIGALGLVYAIRRTLLLFIMAIFFSYLLAPLVKLADYLSQHRFPRALSLAVVFLLLMTLLMGAGAWVATRVAQESSILAVKLPDLLKSTDVSTLPLPSWIEPFRGQILTWIQQQFKSGLEALVPALRTAGFGVIGAIGELSLGILVPILSFFLLLDGHNLHEQIMELLGNARGFWGGILDDVHNMLEQYIRALVILSISAFAAYSIFFQTAGVPYAALLATVGGLLEFIPVAGWITAALTAIVVALFSGYPHVGWMVAFFLIYRGFQDYVLSPYLMSAGVALNPLLILFGILAGEQIGGIPGLFLSVPVLATFRILYVGFDRGRKRVLA